MSTTQPGNPPPGTPRPSLPPSGPPRPPTKLIVSAVFALATATALAGAGVIAYAVAESALWPMSPDLWWLVLVAVGLTSGAARGLLTSRPPRIHLRVGSPPTA